MTFSVDEALQDAHEAEHGYDQDVSCSDCGEAAIVRFRDGEPTDESAMRCHCGGEFEAC